MFLSVQPEIQAQAQQAPTRVEPQQATHQHPAPPTTAITGNPIIQRLAHYSAIANGTAPLQLQPVIQLGKRAGQIRQAAIAANVGLGLNPRGTGRARRRRPPERLEISHERAHLVEFEFNGERKNGLEPGSDYTHKTTIDYTGTRAGDDAAANANVGLAATPDDYTWHHYHNYKPATNRGTMYLMDRVIHAAYAHSGGVWMYTTHHGVAYG